MNKICECDSCGKTYTTTEGLRYHYKNTECSVDGVKCPTCGESFGNEHGVRAHHSQVHGGPGIPGTVIVECEWCGDEIERKACKLKRSENFFCSGECDSNWKTGRHIGVNKDREDMNLSNVYYGPNWSEQRKKRLERDNHECVVCGVSNGEHREQYKQSLHVHHIQPKEKFRLRDGSLDFERANRIENLVALCLKCHKRWEGIPLKPQVNP